MLSFLVLLPLNSTLFLGRTLIFFELYIFYSFRFLSFDYSLSENLVFSHLQSPELQFLLTLPQSQFWNNFPEAPAPSFERISVSVPGSGAREERSLTQITQVSWLKKSETISKKKQFLKEEEYFFLASKCSYLPLKARSSMQTHPPIHPICMNEYARSHFSFYKCFL